MKKYQGKYLEDVELEVMELAIEGLFTDGGHHKQWFLEQILRSVDCDLNLLEQEYLYNDEESWDKGIAP